LSEAPALRSRGIYSRASQAYGDRIVKERAEEMGGRLAAPKSALLAAFFSGLFPGLGQLYNGDRRKAALFAIGGVLTGFGPFSPLDVQIDLGDPVRGLRLMMLASLPFLILALWSVVDAVRVARRSNAG
jgi:hypothetical protein